MEDVARTDWEPTGAVPSDLRPSWQNRYKHGLACLTLLALVLLYYFDYLSGRAFIWEDLLRQYYPTANYFCTSISHGRFPFWQPGLLNGVPFYSDLQAGVYYPFTWLLVLFVRDGALPIPVFQWYIAGHIALGGLMMYAYLKHHRLGAVACLVGSIIFCFAGFSALHVIHLPMVEAYAWLPLQLLLIDKALESGRTKYYAFLTLAILLSLLAGFPQALLYDSYLLIGYWLYRCFRSLTPVEKITWVGVARRLGIESLRITGVFVSVLLLGAILLLPSFQHWQESERQNWGFRQMSAQSMPPYYLMQFAVPNAFGVSNGKTSDIDFWGYNRDRIKPEGQNPGCWQYWEFGGYAGQLALIAAVGVLYHRRRFRETPTTFYLIAGLIGVWFMLGRFGGLFEVLYHVLPGISMFRGPARMAGVVDFCLAGLAAFWVQALMTGESPKLGKPVGVLLMSYLLGFGAYCYFMAGHTGPFADSLESHYAGKQAFVSLVLFAGTALCLYGIRVRSIWLVQRVAVFGLVAFVWLDLHQAYGFFHSGNTVPRTYYDTNLGLVGAYTNLVSQVGPVRVAQAVDSRYREILVEPNIPLVHRQLEMSQGYVDFVPQYHVALSQHVTNQETVLDLQNVGMAVGANAVTQQGVVQFRSSCLPRAGFYSSVKVYQTDEEIYEALQSGTLDYRQTVAVRADELGKSLHLGATPVPQPVVPVMFGRQNPECYQIHYTAREPGIIFVSENFFPGWEALDGDDKPLPLIRAFTAFKGIVISKAGSGTITVRFRPMIFRLGALISAMSAVLFGAFYWVLCRRERMQQSGPPSFGRMESMGQEPVVAGLPDLAEAIYHARS